ncbi:MAG: UvrD-helicase domain-containing protein [Bacteroidales bacterium]|nr:UvrD-helicase domain-containing protein [Bacteroidales bacterium]
MPPLNIYKASAGSGKTFALTMEYLKLLFQREGIHRHILAVTFTNKAAGEMKHRILSRLSKLSNYREDEPMEEMRQLVKASGLDEASISRRAGELLETILNDYSGFSVGTIDKFFQSVIRAFTKEIGIQPGYNLELDHSRVLSLAVDRLFQDLGNRPELQAWLIRFAEERMEESRSWNFREEIIQLGMQLFKESFQNLFLKYDISLLSKENLDFFYRELNQMEEQTRREMSAIGNRALQQMESLGLGPEDFYLKSKSPSSLFVIAGKGEDVPFSESKLQALELSEKWLKKDSSSAMRALTEDQLMPLLNEVYRLQVDLNTVAMVRDSFYTLGILADTWEYVREYTRERNLFLIADSSRFLRGIIGGNQVPFVYERTGSRYNHIMLDEFQDTSLFQYDNFRPLLDNSLAAGQQNLVVGDVKQSIYRWRNSDWKILATELERDFAHQEVRIDTLKRNYRSREQIIRFNNTVFRLSSQLLAEMIERELLASPISRDEAMLEVERFRLAYKDVVQEIPEQSRETGGFVRGLLFDDEELSFRDQVLEALPGWVEEIRQTGIEPGETAILVRTRKEGVAVANRLLEHARQSGNAGEFRLISNESLLLVQNSSVTILVSLLRYLVQPDHRINNLLLKYQCSLLGMGAEIDTDQLYQADTPTELFFPETFMKERELLKQLPLYELIESLISLFSLGDRAEDLPYIQAFQDTVIDLHRREPVGIKDFLDYWEQHGSKRAISVSEESNALRILTIHKSKGLEFKAVIVPFCDWEVTTVHRNSEVLWCETEGTPLDRIPIVPVKFISRMIHTRFSRSYYRERMKGYMDKLNLMYVAFTRARDLLYIGIPKREVHGVKSTGDLLQAILNKNPGEEPCTAPLHTCVDANVLTIGELPAYSRKRAEKDPWLFRSYPVNRDKRAVKVRLRSDQYFVDEEGVFRTGRMYGNMMHLIFSRIVYGRDLAGVLDAMQREGQIPGNERNELERLIRRKLSGPLVKEWFSEGENKRVFNERTLLCGDESILRPDRVILEGNRLTVIDFKFGDLEKSAYKSQVSNYMEKLEEMGFEHMEGYIWYVMLDKTVKI